MDQMLVDKVDQIFADVSGEDSPGCAVGIVQNRELIYARGFGMANLECGMPILPSSVFHVASVSKQFTCMAILLLAAQQKLCVDDDVRKYIPELPDYGQVMTIGHLAHHTSGLRDQWDLLRLAGWREDDVKTNEDMLYLACRQRALNFKPGDEYLYSNTGYTLLALIVERVTGQSFRAFTQEHIFDPLGMTSTHFRDDHTELVVGRTSAYVPRDDGGYRVKIPMFDTVGATSLFTTVEDLALWHTNFETGVVGQSVMDQMHTQGVLNNGEVIAYAFGLSIDVYRGLKRVQHSGSDAGYRSHFVRFPEQNAAMIVLSNLSTANPGQRVKDMTDVYFEGVLMPANDVSSDGSPPVAQVQDGEMTPADYMGVYYSYDVDATYTIFENENGLHISHPKHGTALCQILTQDTFQVWSTKWAFLRSADGTVCGASVSTGRVRQVWFVKK